MIGREPSKIWQDSLEDGQRRLERSAKVLAATGLLGGFHVDLARNTSVAVVGNVAGGVLLVAFVRSIQAGAE